MIINVTTMVAEFGMAQMALYRSSKAALDQLAAAAPTGRPGLPEEIASAIVYLASDDASFVQRAVLPVDGERVAV